MRSNSWLLFVITETGQSFRIAIEIFFNFSFKHKNEKWRLSKLDFDSTADKAFIHYKFINFSGGPFQQFRFVTVSILHFQFDKWMKLAMFFTLFCSFK